MSEYTVTPMYTVIYYREGELDIVGLVVRTDHIPNNCLECDGRFLKVADYGQLYTAIGDRFCPATIKRAPKWWDRVKAFLGFSVDLTAPNPLYRSGYFQLPEFPQPSPLGEH